MQLFLIFRKYFSEDFLVVLGYLEQIKYKIPFKTSNIFGRVGTGRGFNPNLTWMVLFEFDLSLNTYLRVSLEPEIFGVNQVRVPWKFYTKNKNFEFIEPNLIYLKISSSGCTRKWIYSGLGRIELNRKFYFRFVLNPKFWFSFGSTQTETDQPDTIPSLKIVLAYTIEVIDVGNVHKWQPPLKGKGAKRNKPFIWKSFTMEWSGVKNSEKQWRHWQSDLPIENVFFEGRFAAGTCNQLTLHTTLPSKNKIKWN